MLLFQNTILKDFIQSKIHLQISIFLILFVTIFGQQNDSLKSSKLYSKYYKIAEDIVNNQTNAMRNNIKSAVENLGMDPRFLVSTDVMNLENVDEYIKAKIERRKKAIEEIIWQIAWDIEQNSDFELKLKSNRLELVQAGMTQVQKEMAKKINNAIVSNTVSLKSVVIALKIVNELCKDIYKNAISEKNPEKKYNAYIEYTAFVYEMSSIAIKILDDFNPKGKDVLQKIYQERKTSIDNLKGRMRNRKEFVKQKFNNKKITKEKFKQKISDLDGMIKGLDLSLMAWDGIIETLTKQEEWTKKIKNGREQFKELRDDAGLQLDFFAEIGIARAVLVTLQDIEELLSFSEIPLLPIDEDIVRQLLGLKPTKKDTSQKDR